MGNLGLLLFTAAIDGNTKVVVRGNCIEKRLDLFAGGKKWNAMGLIEMQSRIRRVERCDMTRGVLFASGCYCVCGSVSKQTEKRGQGNKCPAQSIKNTPSQWRC